MKKTFFIILMLTTYTLSAQITITSGDLMDAGDSVQLANVVTVPAGFKPGPAGPDMHWDFTNLTSDTSEVLRFVDPAETPYGASFPSSNIAIEGKVAGYDVEGWAYGTKNLSLFQIDGAGGSYDIFEDIVVPFNPPEVMFDFPLNYLDSLDQSTTIDIRLDSPEPTVDSIRVKVVTSLDSRVDAWGELMTPVWTGQVLRIREVRTTIDSAWIKLLFFWVFLEANSNTSVTYKYMGNNVGYPSLQFNADTSENVFSGVNYVLDAGVGVKELAFRDGLTFDLFPNPADDMIHIRMKDSEAEGAISVFDISGRQLMRIPLKRDQQEYAIDVSAYPIGIYQLVMTADGRGASARKFVVR